MLVHHLPAIKKGLYFGLTNWIPILKNPILRSHLLQILLYSVLASFILYLLLHFILLLPRFIVFILGIESKWSTTTSSIHNVVFVQLQNCALLLGRYVYPQPIDKLFFESMLDYATFHRHEKGIQLARTELLKLDHPFSFSLLFSGFIKNPRGSITVRVLKAAKRTCKRVGLLFVCYLLSFLPILGPFVFPLVTFIYLRGRLGSDIAIVVLISSIQPTLYLYLKSHPLQLLGTVRQLCLELMEPILSRNTTTNYVWLKKNQWFLMGIVGIYIPFLAIPVLGPITFCLMECVIGYTFLSLDFPFE
jgi:hypothetical protein